MSLTGEPGGRPVRMGLPIGDLAGGMFGAFAVAAALLRRQTTGQGAHVDLSLLDCQASLLTYLAQYFWADGRVPGPQGSGHASVVPYQALATRDGHLIVAVFAEKFWRGFCLALGRAEWEQDPRFATNRDRVAHRAVLMPLVEAIVATRTTDEWLARLTAEGVPATPILTVDGVLTDPQVKARQMVVEMRSPTAGRGAHLGTPVKVDGGMGLTVSPPPALGEHTDAVLREIARIFRRQRLADLRRRAGVIHSDESRGPGRGHGAHATAADLALAGHAVRLWRRTGAELEALRAAGGLTLIAEGRRGKAVLDRVTADLAEAIAGADVIVIPLPATSHEDVARRLAPLLTGKELLLLTPGTFGAFVMAREIARAGGRLPRPSPRPARCPT